MMRHWRTRLTGALLVLLLVVGIGSLKSVSGQWQASIAPAYRFINLVLTNGSVIISRSAGVLHSVTINNVSRGVDGVFQLCDTNNLVGCSATSTSIATIGSATSTMTYLYDLAFTKGLVVSATSTTPADVTVTWN